MNKDNIFYIIEDNLKGGGIDTIGQGQSQMSQYPGILAMFCWRHFSKTEVVRNDDLNVLAL